MRRVKQSEARRRRSMTAPALTTHQRDALLTARQLLEGADVDGYGPYKPVPPPKPLPASGFQPPPYRMPPYPQHGGPEHPQPHELPGAMMGEPGIQAGLQTHSSKFPIEREVILTSGVEKSSATFKARLLPEFRGPGGPSTSRLQPVHSPRGQHRPAPAAIAPDAPARHLAWTPDSTPKHRVSLDAEQLILTRVHAELTEEEIAHQRAVYKAHTIHDMQRGHAPHSQDPHGIYVRSPYMPGGPENPYMYTSHTGAVPRGWSGPRPDDQHMQQHMSGDPRVFSPQRSRPAPPQPSSMGTPHMNGHAEPRGPPPSRAPEQEPPSHRPPPPPVETEESKSQQTPQTPKTFPAKTYHTIKDMISTRFGGKGAPDAESGNMNNSRQSQLRASGKSLKSEPAQEQQPREREQYQQQQQQQQQQQNQQQPRPQGRGYQEQKKGDQSQDDEGGFVQSSYSRPAAEGKSEAEGEYYYARGHVPDGNGLYVAMRYQQPHPPQQQQQQSQSSDQQPQDSSRVRATLVASREAGDGGGRASGGSSDYEKATHSSGSAAHTTDSGRGPSLPPPGKRELPQLDTSTESSDLSPQSRQFGASQSESTLFPSTFYRSSNNESEWVDLVETELRQILDPRLHHAPPPTAAPRHGASTLSESMGSMTPPLPPLSPSGSPCASPKLRHYKMQPNSGGPSSSAKGKQSASASKAGHSSGIRNAASAGNLASRGGWSVSRGKNAAPLTAEKSRGNSSNKKDLLNKGKMVLSPLHTFGPPDSAADMTSTTTGLDLDSVLDGQTENTSDDDEDDDLSTTVDATDAQAIRRQLEGLENMYSEVLKMLGVKKYGAGGRYLPDARTGGTGGRRRLYGSLSSLPSSVSSRPVRERRGRQDDRKRVKDVKGVNKRFQRLESHVVTLARSVAHLSSEMRTQHLMIQEMENIRGEIAQLRASQPPRSHSVPRLAPARSAPHDPAGNASNAALLGNTSRIKKLTKFFGDEPPLLRLFLRKLGYEKYASNFEQEKVGLMELPYMSEERLQKMGIPMGPRLRILQEAQVAAVCGEGFSVYVV